MDFQLTDEQELIKDSVAKLCSDFPDEYWAQKDKDHEFPWDFYNAMAEAGWIGIAIPEAYGGSGQGITEASLVLEQVAASGAAMPRAGDHVDAYMQCLGAQPKLANLVSHRELFSRPRQPASPQGCSPATCAARRSINSIFLRSTRLTCFCTAPISTFAAFRICRINSYSSGELPFYFCKIALQFHLHVPF